MSYLVSGNRAALIGVSSVKNALSNSSAKFTRTETAWPAEFRERPEWQKLGGDIEHGASVLCSFACAARAAEGYERLDRPANAEVVLTRCASR